MNSGLEKQLIGLAKSLAGSPDCGQVAIRRAISSAYYSVFHALAQLCAKELLGQKNKSETSDFEKVYRAIEHGSMKKAFQDEPLRTSQKINQIGLVVIRLQSERHRSDYLPSSNLYTFDECQQLLSDAEFVLASIRTLSKADRRTLAINLLFKKRT